MAQTYTENQTIVGYFDDHEDARSAVEALRERGFSSAHLGVAHRGGSSSPASSTGSALGEKGAAVWDKVKSFFDGGNAAEPYADERTQGDLASREVTPNPADDHVGHADLHESLSGLSVPDERSRYFGHRFSSSESGAVVTVNAGARAADAEAILTQYGADLGEGAEDYEYTETPQVEGKQDIQLLGEVLRVHKDRISRGEVRLRKEVITETQTVQVPVTREELVIERRAVDGDTPVNGTIGVSEEIRIPLSEERASVDKSTVVREQVAVGKKPVAEVRDLSSEIRHEELVVEDETRRAVNE